MKLDDWLMLLEDNTTIYYTSAFIDADTKEVFHAELDIKRTEPKRELPDGWIEILKTTHTSPLVTYINETPPTTITKTNQMLTTWAQTRTGKTIKFEYEKPAYYKGVYEDSEEGRVLKAAAGQPAGGFSSLNI